MFDFVLVIQILVSLDTFDEQPLSEQNMIQLDNVMILHKAMGYSYIEISFCKIEINMMTNQTDDNR